jgi:hypothetical protein
MLDRGCTLAPAYQYIPPSRHHQILYLAPIHAGTGTFYPGPKRLRPRDNCFQIFQYIDQMPSPLHVTLSPVAVQLVVCSRVAGDGTGPRLDDATAQASKFQSSCGVKFSAGNSRNFNPTAGRGSMQR